MSITENPTPARRRALKSVAERLWRRVDRSIPEGCWLWPGATSNGYGRINTPRRMAQAHRVAWELERGPIADGMVLDHMCHQPLCINPSHLREVTPAQNAQNRKGPTSRNKSGVLGVAVVGEKFQVTVAKKYIGIFSSLTDAAAASAEARKRLMPFSECELTFADEVQS